MIRKLKVKCSGKIFILWGKIPPGLPYDTTIFIIDVTKTTYLLGEIIRNTTIHKKLIPFLYRIGVLQSNAYYQVDCTGFEHMITRVPHLFQIWVVKCISGVGGGNDMIY